MINKIRTKLKQWFAIVNRLRSYEKDMAIVKESLGRIEKRQLVPIGKKLTDKEFKVYSQFGEDGIIQFLISQIPIENKIFVEFGVENYLESNTRFLVLHNNWSGLVIDGSSKNVEFINNDFIRKHHDLRAMCLFVTKENINQAIKNSGISGDIGLLSVDIDGVDYWIWDSINVISPRIVVCEYNSVFGKSLSITVPYKPDFYRADEHYSKIYYGASVQALNSLAQSKGYVLVGSNSHGNNLFFVRADLQRFVSDYICSPEDAYVRTQLKQCRYKDGKLNEVSLDEQLMVVDGMTFYDVSKKQEIKLMSSIQNEQCN